MNQPSTKNGMHHLPNDALWKLKFKIHAAYIIGILLAVIVLLASIRFGSIPGLADRLSFALTLASLLLAVLAIGYNVITNTSFSKTISTLEDASKDIATTSRSVSESAKDLSTKIEVIPSRLESMEGKFAEMSLLIKQPTDKQTQTSSDVTEVNRISQMVEYFIKKDDVGGMLIIYICSLSLKMKKSFSPLEFNGFNLLNGSYIVGINTILSTFGFVKFQITGTAYETTYLHPKLEIVTRPFIEQAIANLTKSSGNKNLPDLLIPDIEKVDIYFRSK
jgi:hypothetical protein